MATVSMKRFDYRTDEREEYEPVVRFSLGGGCPEPNCHCSDEPFVAISNGETWAFVQLDADEADRIRRNPDGVFEFYPDVDWD